MRNTMSTGGSGCHDEPVVRGETPISHGVVALVGSPNCGKTTLFNWLTGSKFKTVNYPGSTVEFSIGTTNTRFGEPIFVMDTPGTYSLAPKSPDERVTEKAIFSHKTFGAARVVVAIADATQLWRHLLLTKQILDSGFRCVLAITMSDLLQEKGEKLDTTKLSSELGVPVVLIDGRLGGGVQELAEVIRVELAKPVQKAADALSSSWTDEKVENTMKEMALVASRAVSALPPRNVREATRMTARERTRKIDHWLLHPIYGLLVFAGLMMLVFSSIFWAAAPIMDGIDGTLSFIGDHLLALNPDNLILQFISGGVLASATSVLVFVPQIFILFLGIILLEDSGYLARSATLIDRPLSALGMGGRSFVPILSGYACAVPAMMAARTINSKRERILTLFILPLMSCSARLPIYALMLSFLFHGQAAWKGGLTLTAIYFSSLLIGGVAALIAGRFLKVDERSFFMMELPVYRKPKSSIVLRQAVARTKSYIVRAGPAIFLFALIIWAATTFPNYKAAPTERLSSSYAGQLGRVIEPVFEPMGGDWRTGVGLMSAFAAREVFVSSLAVVFQITEDGDKASLRDSLLVKMQDAKAPNGMPLFTLASVLGLIVFFMIALQCLSTVMISIRESGNWRFAVTQLVVFNVVAYVLAVSLVQGLRALGIS